MKKPKGIMRQVELFTFSKWSHAILDADDENRIVAPDIGYPNGISASPDLKTVYIVSIVARAVLVYDRDESTGDLKLRETVDMGYMPDNLDVDPVTGDVLSAGHALLLDTLKYGERHTDVSPSMVVKVKTNRKGVKGGDGKNYTTEVVLSDDGHFLPGLTTAVSHRGTKKSILTSMYEAPVVCDGIF
ncbi:hypothetical protein HK101_000959 [Irineochytrium annulatum]|nr:hypothetical protein HK101_000959 [Irineochytrium annulatum]